MIRIPLINDTYYELTECFEVKLSISDNERPSRVSIGQASATVIIFDDDGQSFLFDLVGVYLYLTNFRANVWTQSNKKSFE